MEYNYVLQGFGLTRRMLSVRVGRIVRRLGIRTPFHNGVPGKDWINGFLKRHSDISLRKPQALSTVRARMLNQTVTNNYFKTLADIFKQLDLTNKPMCIWNIDETSVPLLHKPSRVLGQTGSKNIPGRVGNNRDNVSVLACVNAAGGEIPSLVIVKVKTYKCLNAYNTSEGVPGSVYTYQERAWMEDALGEIWFQDHFLKHCGPQRPQLIILDSHSSHETLGLIDAAVANNIALLAFPPHTTQWLCPLDKTIFGPLSREYSRVCTEFMAANPNNLVSKWEWTKLFRLAHDRAFSVSNITSGFKKCGIYPLNPNAIPATAIAPSKPFEVPSTQITEKVHCTTQPSATVTYKHLLGITSCTGNADVTQCTTDTIASPISDTTCTVVSEQDFINLVLSGEIPCTFGASGSIDINLPIASKSVSPSLLEPQPSCSQWYSELENEFTLPLSDRTTVSKPNVRKLTSHRILTSTEIYNKKKEDSEKKEKIKTEKEERKKKRQVKKQNKENSRTIKK